MLENLPEETKDLYLLGDIFDFWYEYKNIIPSGFTRTLGALANLADKGVKIHYFTGNHDIWLYRYFQNELGAEVLKKPQIVEINGKRFFLAHGDGIWHNPLGYRLLEWLFKCRTAQVLFSALIHPRWAFAFGNWWSKHNRLTKEVTPQEYEKLLQKIKSGAISWAEKFQQSLPKGEKIDYFVMGHFHTPFTEELSCGGKFFMLGDWIHHPDYLLSSEDSTEVVSL